MEGNNREVEAFILEQDPLTRRTLLGLHQLLIPYPGITAKIAYRIPFYYRKSRICYLNPLKGGGVELAFTRGNELMDESGVLDSRGRAQVSGIRYNNPSEIDPARLNPILQQAILIDATSPYRSPKKKSRRSTGSSFDTP